MSEAGAPSRRSERLGFLGRILDYDGYPLGTCFQVRPGVFVASWHVLNERGPATAEALVRLDPLTGGDAFEARVSAVDRAHDLAVMVATTSFPTSGTLSETDAVPVRTIVTVTGHAVLPDGDNSIRYLTASGEWAGIVVRNDIAIGRMTSDGVVPGMSGAPVVRESDGAVIGVVSARYNSADGWLANTVWIARTEDLMPMLSQLNSGVIEPASNVDAAESDRSSPVLRALRTDTGTVVSAIALTDVDGLPIAVSGGEDGELQVWDLATGERRGKSLAGHAGPVWGVALGKLSGTPIAVSGSQDGHIGMWDLARAELIAPLANGHTASINSIALGMREDRLIAISASDDQTVRVWDVADGRLVSTLTGHEDWVNSVAVGMLDGRLVAVSGSADQTVRVWDLADGQLISTMTGHTGSVSSVAVGVLDGRSVAVSGSADKTIRIWDLIERRPISTMMGHTGRVRTVSISADASWSIASGADDRTVRVWDLADGTPSSEILGEHSGSVRALGIVVWDGSPTVVSGGDDGFIRSWTPARTARQQDQVEWLSDSPARADLLHRRPLAQALATRLRRFHDEEPDTSFLVHIDGEWGTGKSTLINLLRSELAEDWLTVDFNAWRESRIGPPWWALLAAVRHDLRSRLSRPRRMWLRFAESWVRARRGGAPYAFALLFLLVVAAIVFVLLRPHRLTLSSVGSMGTAVTAAIAAFGALWTGALVAGRFLLWDSARGARLYEQSNSNPMQDIADHFAWLISRAKRPIVFFVDDLDRCTETYVVDFLEAVQTLVRDSVRRIDGKSGADTAAASFVIAADGAWIRTSYEIAYQKFESSVGDPGRPLGYLFLDKLFQLRTPVPSIDPRRQHEYLRDLLQVRRPEEVSEIVDEEERSVRARLQQSSTETEVVDTLRSASPVVRDRVAAAAVQKLSAPEVIIATEHALQRFAPLLAANPRSMKRFVNDYSILRAVRTLEGNPVRSQPLALWAILETQWPALADYLRHAPEAVTKLGDPAADLDDSPVMIRPLFKDPNVRRLVTFEYGGPLTADLISSCCGARPLPAD